MAKQSLVDFGNSSSDFIKALVAAEAKVGKTTYLVASALGALPGQTAGLVDKPEHLHILGFDEAFVDGLLRFLTESCKLPKAYCGISVHDLAEFRRKSGSKSDWDYDLFNAVNSEIQSIKADVAKGGVHVVIVSSVTGLSEGLQNGMGGPPNPSKKGGGMDQSKWQDFARQLASLRNLLQVDTHHTLWEGHITKSGGGAGKDDEAKETISLSGKTGINFTANTEQVFRLRREMSKYPGTTIDKVFVDTRPSMDFMSGGRGFNDSLAPKEYNLVDIATKLEKKVGGMQVTR